ncbi:serine hydrolase domain-containing protein [Acidobacteriota bacterium]
MKTLTKIKFAFFCSFVLLANAFGQQLLQYKNAEEIGLSSQKLNKVIEIFEISEGASLLVLHKGNVILSEGETTRRFRCASMRKSIMNAMIGIAIENGKIKLKSTLAELGIDDKPKLTEEEKSATVEDLLSARSGVYHLASYMPSGMEDNIPERGCYKPGEFWFYNNWDFNTLVTIYNQQTGSDFFEDFFSQIAQPLGMEDFSLDDTFYRYEEDKSIHPAYLFRMSSRDLARFGQLYLNKGMWNGDQIVPEDWIEQSTKAHSEDLGQFDHKGGYGYLWWIGDSIFEQKMYYASGSGGQRIIILPEEELVIVHLVNTYENNDVKDQEIFNLTQMIIDLKEGMTDSIFELVPYTATKIERPEFVKVAESTLKMYEGTYHHRFLGETTISLENSQMYMLMGIGKFKIHPTSENTFYPEDIQTPMEFVCAENESKTKMVETKFNENGKVGKAIFYY